MAFVSLKAARVVLIFGTRRLPYLVRRWLTDVSLVWGTGRRRRHEQISGRWFATWLTLLTVCFIFLFYFAETAPWRHVLDIPVISRCSGVLRRRFLFLFFFGTDVSVPRTRTSRAPRVGPTLFGTPVLPPFFLGQSCSAYPNHRPQVHPPPHGPRLSRAVADPEEHSRRLAAAQWTCLFLLGCLVFSDKLLLTVSLFD